MADLLDHSVADIVAQLLVDLGVAVSAGTNSVSQWEAHVNREVDKPDEAITVYDTEGRSDGRVMVTGALQSHPAIQVRVRARDHETAHARAKAIADKFDTVVYHNTVTLDSTQYCVQSISRTSSFSFAGTDAPTSKRVIFTINAYVTVRQLA